MLAFSSPVFCESILRLTPSKPYVRKRSSETVRNASSLKTRCATSGSPLYVFRASGKDSSQKSTHGRRRRNGVPCSMSNLSNGFGLNDRLLQRNGHERLGATKSEGAIYFVTVRLKTESHSLDRKSSPTRTRQSQSTTPCRKMNENALEPCL